MPSIIIFIEIAIIFFALGVCAHAMMDLWKYENHEHEIDLTPFGKPRL